MIVVDLTVLMPMLVRGGARFAAVKLVSARDPVWLMPDIWRLEACNQILDHVRSTGESLYDAQTHLYAADMLIRQSHEEVNAAAVLELALETDLTASQAVYVLTARAIGAKLVTADFQLLTACPDTATSIETFGAGAG